MMAFEITNSACRLIRKWNRARSGFKRQHFRRGSYARNVNVGPPAPLRRQETPPPPYSRFVMDDVKPKDTMSGVEKRGTEESGPEPAPETDALPGN
ncbi:hypothetical protein RR48_14507 [Papilio machaon]|uniref:Uncharacterized protein n=1 Tax=Papilio machaon TaxID=76193 RepID=A0A194QM79_PAPMA|nr:hypothetical protein RR48_14507 [Papilio machaon]